MSSKPDESEANETPLDISHLDIYRLLEVFVFLLNEQAWRYLGLRVDPKTNEVSKDAERAHVAIDCIIALVNKLEPRLEEDAKNRYRNLLTDLQINYANQFK